MSKLTRRSVLRAGLAAAATGALPLGAVAGEASATKTFVLVHGAWHGGWCWKEVAQALRALGHGVSTPTQTGLGERRHLLSKDITLDTFITDVVNHIETEELNDIILLGHSFGGAVITGAADRIPGRIRHLVYLDSVLLENGQSVFSVLPADVMAQRRRTVAEQGSGVSIPPPPLPAFGVPEDHRLAGWVKRHLAPHPVGTYESPLQLRNPVGNGRPCTYITCTAPIYGPLEGSRQWARKQNGWKFREIATGHDAMVTAPAELARLLVEIG